MTCDDADFLDEVLTDYATSIEVDAQQDQPLTGSAEWLDSTNKAAVNFLLTGGAA